MSQKEYYKPENQQIPAGDRSKKTESAGLKKPVNNDLEKAEDQQPRPGSSSKETESEGLETLANMDQDKPEDLQSRAGGSSHSGSSEKTESEGLNKLSKVNEVIMKQKKEQKDETKIKYEIKDSLRKHLFVAEEEVSNCCERWCCGALGRFYMQLKDGNKEVIHLNRPMKCVMCCFPCCLQYLEVSSPDGTMVGTVQQEWSLGNSVFNICDQDGNVVMKITGPISCSCGDVDFKLTSPDGKEVGQITKSGGETKEDKDVDYFGISFPEDLDVNTKGTLIGAAMLIFMFFDGNDGVDCCCTAKDVGDVCGAICSCFGQVVLCVCQIIVASVK